MSLTTGAGSPSPTKSYQLVSHGLSITLCPPRDLGVFFFFLKTVGFQPSSCPQGGSQDSNPAKGAGRATLLLAASLLREEAVASRGRAAFPGDGGVLRELRAGATLCFGLNRSWARTGRGPPRRSQRGHFGTMRSDPRSSSRRDTQPWPTLRNKKCVPRSAASVRSDLGYEKERRRGSANGAEVEKRGQGRNQEQ